MSDREEAVDSIRRGLGLDVGERHYRAFVGPPETYDLVSAMQFNLLTALGLREYHYVLDVGCGSLRSGKLLIPYLLPGRYHGIEPERWLVEEGVKAEIGVDQMSVKGPTFDYSSQFEFGVFGRQFDFLLAQSILSHTSPAQTSACLRSAREVMSKGSIFVATFVEGIESYRGDSWVYPECVTYRWSDFKEMIEDAGLRGIRLKWSHPGWQTWVAITDPRGPRAPALMDPVNASRVVNFPLVRMALGVRSWIKTRLKSDVGS